MKQTIVTKGNRYNTIPILIGRQSKTKQVNTPKKIKRRAKKTLTGGRQNTPGLQKNRCRAPHRVTFVYRSLRQTVQQTTKETNETKQT